MKKTLLILCTAFVFALTGCGNDNSGADKGAKTVDDVFASSAKDSQGDVQTSAQTSSSSAEKSTSDESSRETVSYDKIDTDLSAMNDTMAYAQFVNIITDPDKYKGKTIKAKGTFAVAEENGNTYFACMLTDATACCSQPLEFVLADTGRKYPADYPALESQITVVGKFGMYNEGANVYYHLTDAQLVSGS
ncbi:MAG: hypothetical protein II703_06975 [Ruminococcus sp.]|nr:hypothetical protein [Ruminococcus sp.]